MDVESCDITEEFFQACKELSLGELVKHEEFNLSDAMSAIEILDPKMDTGMNPLDDSLGLAKAIENGKVNVSDVVLSDLIAISDANLAMIVNWLCGQSLDQTVYTNICLLERDLVKDPVLFGFCTATLNFVQCAKLCIGLAGVYNEEDYSAYAFGVKFPTNNFVPLCGELDTAIEIIRMRKSEKEELKLLEAVEARLCLFQSMFELFPHLFSTSDDMVPNLKKGLVAVDRTLSWMAIVLDTITLGTQPPESIEDSDFSWLPYFQPQINRQYSLSSFPRDPKLTTRVDALKYMHKFLKTLRLMLIELPEKIRDLEGLLLFLRKFGGADSCLFSRSIAQLLIMPNDHRIGGLYPLVDIIYESLQRLDSCLSGENTKLSLLSNPMIQDRLQNFLTFSVKAFAGVFQVFGHNIARQRNKLLRNSFEDFRFLQSLASEIEQRNSCNTVQQSTILSTFLLFHILQLMHYHMELGFFLDLFVPYEFVYVYWYFGEIISKNLATLLERRCSILVLDYSKTVAALDNKKPNKKQQLKQRAEMEFLKKIHHMQTAILMLKIDNFLSYAFIKFALGLKLSNRLKIPTGEKMRYEQRFEVYCNLSAMLYIPYETFINSSGIEIIEKTSANQCFSEASKHFEDAVNFFKNFENQNADALTPAMKSLMRISKQNAIVSKLLAASSNLNKKVVFDVCDRPIFPLIKLT